MASSREEGELLESSSSSSEEEEEEEDKTELKFKNDGSFMEMFKKMQETKSATNDVKTVTAATSITTAAASDHKTPVAEEKKKPGLMSIIGKRRGGKSLPTGLVKKQKLPEEEEPQKGASDAWSQYMQEVKKYKERLGDEEDKNRPLVK